MAKNPWVFCKNWPDIYKEEVCPYGSLRSPDARCARLRHDLRCAPSLQGRPGDFLRKRAQRASGERSEPLPATRTGFTGEYRRGYRRGLFISGFLLILGPFRAYNPPPGGHGWLSRILLWRFSTTNVHFGAKHLDFRGIFLHFSRILGAWPLKIQT